MKVKTEKEVDIIRDITLLSIAEYEKYKDIIPLVDGWWWLRSPGYYSDRAARVLLDGVVDIYGDFVEYYDSTAVRPALIFSPKPSLKKGDKIYLAGYTWTIISRDMMLCDDVVGYTYFRKDWEAKNANDYKASDIKKWLHNWWKDVNN